MKRIFAGTAIVFMLIASTAFGLDEVGGPAVGEELFGSKCAKCHGVKGVGSETGPPLVHRIYEPGHHSDWSFRRAISMGVRAHHWRFGDMKRVTGITEEQGERIIEYIRSIQHEAGIF